MKSLFKQHSVFDVLVKQWFQIQSFKITSLVSNHFWKSCHCLQWVLDEAIYQTFFIHPWIIFLPFAFALLCSCLFFPMSSFSSHVVFAYNFLPVASCHPRHFSPGRLLFSISPAFLYLFQTDSSARHLSFMYLAFKLYFWRDQVQRAGMLLIAKWCIKPMT